MFVRLCFGAVLAGLFVTGVGSAAEAAPPPKAVLDADVIAAIIDRHLAEDWQARGIKPAAPADDGEFARRVYLDLIGRAPKVAELRDFIEDRDAQKRIKLVDKLLTMPSHA